jgi:hypothetical protein
MYVRRHGDGINAIIKWGYHVYCQRGRQEKNESTIEMQKIVHTGISNMAACASGLHSLWALAPIVFAPDTVIFQHADLTILNSPSPLPFRSH